MDDNRESGYLMDQFGSCKSFFHEVSPKLCDSFRPQHIQADLNNVPFKEYTESVKSLNFPSSELQQPFQDIPIGRTSIHVKKFNKVSEKHILIKKEEPNSVFERPMLWKMIYKEKLISRFVENLRKQAHLLPKMFLTSQSSYFRESYLENKHSLFVQKQISQNSIPTLNSTGTFVLVWSFLRALQLMFLMWWLPFKKAFTPDYDINIVETTLIAVFIFDIIIKLNSGFIKEGEMIIDRMEILKHYFYNELQRDTIYLITQLIVFQKINVEVEIIQVFMVFIQFSLNFSKFQRKIKKYGEILATQSSYVQIIDLIQLILLVCYFAHCMACIWYYVGIESLAVYQYSWTTKFTDCNLAAFYLHSFYWAITTMVTVGYGDISAQNNYEILCATILMMFSTGMFAFAINQIGEIFNNLDAEKQNYKRALLLINQYMKKNQIDYQIQSRVRNYLKYQENIKMQSKNEEIDALVHKLPSNIQSDLQKNIQQQIMQEIKFYKSNFSPNVIPSISQSLQIQCFTPKEIIFQQGQSDDCSLYTVWKGEVLIVESQSGKVLATLSKGESFGEREFLTQESHSYTAISKDLSQILKITRDKFLQIVKYSDYDFEQFHKLKDQMIYSQMNGISQCYCCSENHLLSVCPNINYLPNKDRLFNYQIETKSRRQQYQRSGKKRTFCQYQSCKSETSDNNNETYKNAAEVFKNIPQLSIRDQEEQPAKSPMRQKATTPTLMNQKISGQLFHIEEEQYSETSPQQRSNLESQNNEVYQATHRVSQGQVLEIPNIKNRLSLSNTVIPFSSSLNQLDLIKQEFQKYSTISIDRMKSFTNYFPQNNFEIVLLRYKKYQRGKRQVNSESLGELTKKRIGATMKKVIK